MVSLDARLEFRRTLLRRLLALRNPPEAIDEWLRALDDVPDASLIRGIDHALKTRTFFPVPAELRADVEGAPVALPPERERERPLSQPFDVTLPVPGGQTVTLHVERAWRFDCDACADSGWVEYWCGEPPASPVAPDLPVRACDRSKRHLPHGYVRPCACRDSNPTVQRRLAAAHRATTPKGGTAT